MDRVILGAEKHPKAQVSAHRLHQNFSVADESIAMATMYTANHLDSVGAIISMTETGSTPKLMSRISSNTPIFAFTPNVKTENRVALYRGVVPVTFDISSVPPAEINDCVVQNLIDRKQVTNGDWVILSKGDFDNVHGGTNTMKIIAVGEDS